MPLTDAHEGQVSSVRYPTQAADRQARRLICSLRALEQLRRVGVLVTRGAGRLEKHH